MAELIKSLLEGMAKTATMLGVVAKAGLEVYEAWNAITK